MKKRVAFFLCIFFIATMTMACKGCEGGTPNPSPSPSVSPTPTPTPESYWAKAYGTTLSERCFTITSTTDGGYISWGSSNNYSDCLIIKLNKEGGITWQKSFGGSGFDVCLDICQSGDYYFVVTATESFGKGSRDLWLLKLDSSGNILWQKTYGGSYWEDGYAMANTSDGGFIIGGCTNSFGNMNGRMDFYILRFDSNGDLLWQKTYGASDWDVCNAIQQTSDGGFIAGGYSLSFSNGSYDIWLVKLDSSGNVSWQKAYGGSSDDRLNDLMQTADGGYIVGAFTSSFGSGNLDFWLLKLDSTGTIVWQETYGGSNEDCIRSVKQTSDGGYIVGGHTYSFGKGNCDYWVLKIDSSGNITWQYTYGNASEDTFFSVYPINAGYIIGGYSSSFGSGGHDMWILKVDQNGKFGSDEMTSFMTATNVVPKTSNGTSWVTTATSYNASATQTTTNVTPTNPNCIVKTQFPQ